MNIKGQQIKGLAHEALNYIKQFNGIRQFIIYLMI